MKRHQRNLLAVALTAALASPLAFGQSVAGKVTGTVQGTTQVPKQAVEHTVEHATDNAMEATQHTADTASDAAQDTAGTVDRTAQETDASVAADAQVEGQVKTGQENDARQGFAPPAVWATLDANADGHIDAGEASADASFAQKFEAIDTDNDGMVSKAEFRVEPSDKTDDRQY